jgi:chorismate mutase
LRLLTASKPGLHTASEVKGLKQDKVDLLAIVKTLTESLRESNETDRQILDLLKERRDATPR